MRCGYWGLGRVEANVRSIGEIDVAFAIDDTWFILEAKWEQAPVSFDPIAKLSRRITQRLTGTRGVFLSMSLLPGPDGQEWVFDYKTAQWMQFGMSVTLTRLGDGLGQEERHTIDFRAGIWSAVWLSGLRFFLAGDGHFGLVDLDNTTTVPIDERLRSPYPDQRGAVRIDEHTVMTATRHGTVYRIDVETGKSTLMARLDMLALGCDLASGHQGRAYVLEHRGTLARDCGPPYPNGTGLSYGLGPQISNVNFYIKACA